MGLFDYFKRKKIQGYVSRAEDYVKETYIEPEIAPVEEREIEYSSEISPSKKEKTEKTESKSSDIKYSINVDPDDHIRYSDKISMNFLVKSWVENIVLERCQRLH